MINIESLQKLLRYFIFCFSYKIFEINRVFYAYHIAQFRLATFQGLRGHMWLVATVLGSAAPGMTLCPVDCVFMHF